MKSRSILFASVLLALLLSAIPVTLAGAATGSIVDEGFIPAGTQGVIGRQGVKLMESPDYAETASVLRAQQPGGGWKSCSSLTDTACNGWKDITFTSILQPCASAVQLNCIVEFGVVTTAGQKVAATFERSFPQEAWNKYPADEASGLPVGGPGALWTVPASVGLAVSTHYVRAAILGSIGANGKAVFENFAANLTPVSLTTMQCEQDAEWLTSKPNPCTNGDFKTNRDKPGYSGFVEGSGWDQKLDCEMSGNANVTAETAECALRKPASLDTKYFLTIRLAQSPQGWLHGRLGEADVTITSIDGSKDAITLAIVGKSVRVPVVYKELPFGELPSSLQEKYRTDGEWPNGQGGASNWGMQDTDSTSPTGRNRLSIPPPYGPAGIAELEAWMPFLKDTSTADRATWSIRTLRTWERSQANDCLTDKSRVTGLVLTNATQYLAGAPEYNEKTKSLDYKVAAPHYMSNGEEFFGTYQMIVRSDVAKCIYKFGGTAMSATVEVVESASGSVSQAVTTVSESNGWLKLSATGYTHSTPTIRAKFVESTLPAKVSRQVTAKSLAKFVGVKVSPKSRISLAVASSSRRQCQVSGASVKALRKGRCVVTVTVSTGNTKTKRIATILVS